MPDPGALPEIGGPGRIRSGLAMSGMWNCWTDRFVGSIGATVKRLGFWREFTTKERDPQAGAPTRVPGSKSQVLSFEFVSDFEF